MKRYEEPMLEIVRLSADDVIATSGLSIGAGDGLNESLEDILKMQNQ